jgi:hypothetical protein
MRWLHKNQNILPTIVIAEITQITCALRGKDMARSRCQALIKADWKFKALQDFFPQALAL